MSSPDEASSERRPAGLLRVPFVRRCELLAEDGSRENALIVNINVLGAYVAHEASPPLGQALRLRFGVPGREPMVEVRGVVAWINQRQNHPVHSLPLGFGVRFAELGDDARRRITDVVTDYVRRHGVK